MPLFALPNLVSNVVTPCIPWEFTCNAPANTLGKEGKEHRRRWITQATTVHQVYSGFEGMNPGLRISDSRGVDEGNPPLKCHALIADVDLPISEEELEAGIKRLGTYVPNYIERTMSGNVRLLWLLEKPVAFPNFRFAKEWLKLALERTRLDSVSAGFDKPAWEDPNRYYTNSGVWCCYNPEIRIPFAVANGWIVETAEKHVWKKDKGAVEIPLPEVFREIEKKWPGAWPGDFVEEASGPSFWLPGSESAKSAKVKTTGIFTWSAHAVKPFYSWADLLGIQFVQEFKTKMMGDAVAGIYHDGAAYYRTTGYGEWKTFSKEDICSHLRVDRGLSSQKNGDVPSDVDRAVQYIQNWQGIDGAAPFVFQPHGIIKRNGGTFLNTHTRKTLTPTADKAEWGPKGGFPWLSAYFDGLFSPHEQLPYFLSWLSRFYCGAYAYSLESGQNVFLLGPPGVGKTFLSQGILPRLFGGSHDAEDYLLGNTSFNSQLFDVALWTVDDNGAGVDNVTHRKFSSMVKKMAANTTFSYHAKFRIPCSVDWLGRVVVTANDDEESARIVPDLSISLLDKLMLFRSSKLPSVEFPARAALLAILDAELPAFARWLLDFDIPAACQGTARFGVKAYHEPSLLQTAEQSSRSAGFHEVIDDFLEDFFAESKDPYWEGSAWQLVKALHQSDLAVASALRSLTADFVSRNLMSLKAKGFEIETRSVHGTRVWRINRRKTK
jgi:hypothetical protein